MYGKLLSFLRDHRTRTHYYNFSDNSNTLRSRDLTVFAYCVARGMEYVQNKQVRKLSCSSTYFRFSNKPGYSAPVKKKGETLQRDLFTFVSHSNYTLTTTVLYFFMEVYNMAGEWRSIVSV